MGRLTSGECDLTQTDVPRFIDWRPLRIMSVRYKIWDILSGMNEKSLHFEIRHSYAPPPRRGRDASSSASYSKHLIPECVMCSGGDCTHPHLCLLIPLAHSIASNTFPYEH